MVKVSGMYLSIGYNLIFPAKVSKQIRFETYAWKYNLNLISERKGSSLGEFSSPILTYSIAQKNRLLKSPHHLKNNTILFISNNC